MDKLRNEATDFLMDAVLTLKTKEECYAFFEDICTIKEFQSMAQRIVVAKMLDEKTVYSEIEEKTGASSVTISRVSRSLSFGKDGYRLVFDRMQNKE